MNDALRRAIEEIKLRAPIEDVVRERVGGLRRAGALWVACCPFHDERTPSFKVDPRRGTWNCYGACSEGGDQISFVQRMDGVGFRDALEILAARAGVELPRRSGGPDRTERDKPLYSALERARDFYVKVMESPEGESARRYLDERGLTAETRTRFHIGFAPANGQALVNYARRISAPGEPFLASGLVRRNDSGRPYDFFRGRMMIPIADERGRTVGFGARRLEESDGPKYINTSETPLFKKSRLVYGLDRCIQATRRGGDLVLVEGYTDVMAGHQVGFENIAAVLGTSTTEEHAGLLRRAGAKRVFLVFDGDAAGHKAGMRALAGLLPLEIDLRVVVLEEGTDPCDLFLTGGQAGFRERLERADDWFDFVSSGLDGLSGLGLSQGVDEVLALLTRIPKPVHKESLVGRLAERLELSKDGLMAQLAISPEERRARREREEQRRLEIRRKADAARAHTHTSPGTGVHDAEGREEPVEPSAEELSESHSSEAPDSGPPRDARLRRAYGGMVGAVLLDSSLLPLLKPWATECPEEDIAAVIEAMLELDRLEAERIDAATVLTELADHPARALVAPLCAYAEQAQEPHVLIEGEIEYLNKRSREDELAGLTARIHDLEQELTVAGAAATPTDELTRLYARLRELLIAKNTPSLHPEEVAVRGASS